MKEEKNVRLSFGNIGILEQNNDDDDNNNIKYCYCEDFVYNCNN